MEALTSANTPLSHNSRPLLNALKLVMKGFTLVVGLMGRLVSLCKIGPPRIIVLTMPSGRVVRPWSLSAV